MTLSKQAHIELVMQASYWRAQHGRALERLEWQTTQYRELLGQALERGGGVAQRTANGAGQDS